MIPCPSLLTKSLPTAIIALIAAAAPAGAHTLLDSPNGGEILVPGQSFQIEWHISIAHPFLNWDLEYSTNGENGPWSPIATDLPPGSMTALDPHFHDWIVPDISSPNVRVRVFMDAGGGVGWEDISDADFTVANCAPVSYCSTSPNSNGPGAVMSWFGSTSVSANDLTLVVTGASVGQFGLFYYGPLQVQQPFGDGLRCVGNGSTGIFRIYPPFPTDNAGTSMKPISYTQPPMNAGPGVVDPGSTWNFQYWYRDPIAGGSGFNLSDALSVTFCD